MYGFPQNASEGCRPRFMYGISRDNNLLDGIKPCLVRRVNVLLGWAGVAYRPSLFDDGFMQQLHWLGSDGASTADDVYVSAYLNSRHVPMLVVPVPIHEHSPRNMTYSTQSAADLATSRHGETSVAASKLTSLEQDWLLVQRFRGTGVFEWTQGAATWCAYDRAQCEALVQSPVGKEQRDALATVVDDPSYSDDACPTEPPSTRFCLVVAMTTQDGFLESGLASLYLQYGLTGASRYASLHGYTFHPVMFAPPPGQHGSMQRVRLTLQLLRTPKLCDWVMWTEGDSFITNYSVKLEDVVESAQQFAGARDFYFVKDYLHNLNTGIGLLRNSPNTTQTLELVLKMQHATKDFDWIQRWDHNGAIWLLFEHDPLVSAHIGLVPPKLFNTYDGNFQGGNNSIKPVACDTHLPWFPCRKGWWEPGNFLVHFANTKKKELRMRAFLKEFPPTSWIGWQSAAVACGARGWVADHSIMAGRQATMDGRNPASHGAPPGHWGPEGNIPPPYHARSHG